MWREAEIPNGEGESSGSFPVPGFIVSEALLHPIFPHHLVIYLLGFCEPATPAAHPLLLGKFKLCFYRLATNTFIYTKANKVLRDALFFKLVSTGSEL